MSGITLSKKHGVNPKMTYCPNCKEDANELILVGAHDSIYYCHHCKINLIGSSKCPRCNSYGEFQRKIGEYEKLPASQPCDKCKEVLKEQDRIVAEGGILFMCTKCGSRGAIRKNNPICQDVRKQLGVEPPKKCGVEFNECPACEGKEV